MLLEKYYQMDPSKFHIGKKVFSIMLLVTYF